MCITVTEKKDYEDVFNKVVSEVLEKVDENQCVFKHREYGKLFESHPALNNGVLQHIYE